MKYQRFLYSDRTTNDTAEPNTHVYNARADKECHHHNGQSLAESWSSLIY